MKHRIAILTGRSDPGRTGLSKDQLTFLRAVVPTDLEIEPQGFPWVEGALPERDVVLPLAAWRNTAVWMSARLSPRFAQLARSALARMHARGARVVITCSSGFDILCAGWNGDPLNVFVLGPVRPRQPLPGANITTLIGRKDWLSRTLHRHDPDHWVPGGHMSYWTCPQTQAIIRAEVQTPL